jgi:hypothetical protein
MNITELHNRPNLSGDNKLQRIYEQLGMLIKAINNKELPVDTARNINQHVAVVNASALNGADLGKVVKQQQTAILKLLEKEHKIVAKNHYRNMWMLLGFTAFGLPIGTSLGLSIGNIGLIGVGLPIGMAIGAAVGSSMDKKAFNEGRQLDIEIKL